MHPIHLCIGAPRAGTTWLFREMQHHPEVFVPVVKEVCFWNSRRSNQQRDHSIKHAKASQTAVHDPADQAQWMQKWSEIDQKAPITMEAYHDLMAVEGRPTLDISPSYCFLPPKAVQTLRDGLPKGSKVIYMVRDPLDRMLSQVKLHFHLHGAYRGRPSQEDLAAFLAIPDQKRRWDYDSIIKTWGGIFGDDFVALPFNNVIENPKALTHKVADILGITLDSGVANRKPEDFYHSEKNQNSQIWTTSLKRPEKQQIAQALLPAVKNMQQSLPKVSKPWLNKLTTIAEQDLGLSEPIKDVDLSVQKLMRMTESIGDNCEYGFWQRHRNYEPSSLFRWAITPIDSLLNFLDAPTRLYAKQDISMHSAGMTTDAKFGFKFHSKLMETTPDGVRQLIADQEKFDTIHAQEEEKIAHLQKKFFAQMRRQVGLYIIKDNKGIPEDKVRAVLAHLHRHNPNHHLLWVEAGEETTLKDLGNGLLYGTVPAFARYVQADKYHETGWTSLMHKAAQVPKIAEQIARMQR